MQKIKVLVVRGMDDTGIWAGVVAVGASFEDMRRGISPTLVNENVLNRMENFAANLYYPLPSGIVMLHGRDVKDMFPAAGVMYARHDFPGFVFDFIDGPFVFIKTDGAEYTTLEDSDIAQIRGFLYCAYSGYYGGDKYLDYYSPRSSRA